MAATSKSSRGARGAIKVTTEEKCSGCAFRKGTEANAASLTQTMAKLCLIAREPFYCHMRGDIGTVVCTGYEEALVHRPEAPEWMRENASKLLVLTGIALESPETASFIAHNFPSVLAAVLNL